MTRETKLKKDVTRETENNKKILTKINELETQLGDCKKEKNNLES